MSFVVYAAYDTPDTVVIEVNGDSYELSAIEATELANELTEAARTAGAGAED